MSDLVGNAEDRVSPGVAPIIFLVMKYIFNQGGSGICRRLLSFKISPVIIKPAFGDPRGQRKPVGWRIQREAIGFRSRIYANQIDVLSRQGLQIIEQIDVPRVFTCWFALFLVAYNKKKSENGQNEIKAGITQT